MTKTKLKINKRLYIQPIKTLLSKYYFGLEKIPTILIDKF